MHSKSDQLTCGLPLLRLVPARTARTEVLVPCSITKADLMEGLKQRVSMRYQTRIIRILETTSSLRTIRLCNYTFTPNNVPEAYFVSNMLSLATPPPTICIAHSHTLTLSLVPCTYQNEFKSTCVSLYTYVHIYTHIYICIHT